MAMTTIGCGVCNMLVSGACWLCDWWCESNAAYQSYPICRASQIGASRSAGHSMAAVVCYQSDMLCHAAVVAVSWRDFVVIFITRQQEG